MLPVLAEMKNLKGMTVSFRVLFLVKCYFVVAGFASFSNPSLSESPLPFIACVVLCTWVCLLPWGFDRCSVRISEDAKCFQRSFKVPLPFFFCLIVREVMLLLLLLLLLTDLTPSGWKIFTLRHMSSGQIRNQIPPTGSINLCIVGI